jgi:cytochrome oxidase Cu insertion factor (SCO1/SenC/PrrC family)
MRARDVFLALCLSAAAAGASAQRLGPADGASLPPIDAARIKPGVPAPDFTLEDGQGRPITLSALRGHVVILTFYRGHW